jgi:hypothetical protein
VDLLRLEGGRECSVRSSFDSAPRADGRNIVSEISLMIEQIYKIVNDPEAYE